MYVVIFRAVLSDYALKDGAESYASTAQALRKKALQQYGCIEFACNQEGNQEIALSYWADLDSIRKWKDDDLHSVAQQRGRESYYTSYQVDVAAVERSYGMDLPH